MSEQNNNKRPPMMGGRGHGPGNMAMGRPAEKAKDFKGTLNRLLRYLKPQRLKLAVVLFFAIASTIFTVMGPKITGTAVNQLTDGYIAKTMVNQISTAQKSVKDGAKKMTDGENKAIEQATQQAKDAVKAEFDKQIEAKKSDAVKSAEAQATAVATQKFNEAVSAQKAQALAQAQAQAQASVKQKAEEAAMAQAQTQAEKDAAKAAVDAQFPQQFADAIAQANAAATDQVNKAFDAKKSEMDAQLAAAKQQAIKAADAAVDKAFADQQATMDAQLKDAQDKAVATVKDKVHTEVLKQANMTESQYQTLLKMAALKNIKDEPNADKKADILNTFIQDGKKLPQTGEMKQKEVKQDQLDKAIADVRETNGVIPFDSIMQTLFFLLAIYILSSLFTFIMQYVMSTVAQKTVYQLRKEMDEKLSRMPLKYFDGHTNGEILSRMTNDIDTISTTLQQSLTQVITSVCTMIGYIVMMLTVSPIMTLLVIATLPLYMIATFAIAKNSQRYYVQQQRHLGELSGHTEEMFTGHKIVKAFGHEEESVEIFHGINDNLYKVGWKAQFISGIMFPLMNFIGNIGYVLIAVVGGIFVTQNRLNVGDIVSFIQYSRSFTQPIIQTANIANIIQSTIACAERVFELLDEEEEIPDTENAAIITNPRGEVLFDHVKFSYKEDRPLIEDMNLDIKQGDTIAIVGPTGAGKTTLVNLLMRFYEIQGGSITFDGVDIRNIKRGDLRKMFGMVLQDTWLFNGTIRDNIAYGYEGASEIEIVNAAKAAHADHFIRSLPEGYNTVLNEEGTNISQGQKQLLTIARAFLADPAVLILDEATSSVDTRTEVLIQKAMSKLMKGRTNFVIAHRLSTIRDADTILVMNNGTIIESGNHQSLLDKGGFYADLYNSQFLGASIDEKEA